MGLSTNVLWHQTDNMGLEAILKNKCFKCSYSLETICWKSSIQKIAFPMISFCDIAMADIQDYIGKNDKTNHEGKYGIYTIGMRREWGKSVRLSPVWYRDSEAASLRNQMDAFKNVINTEFKQFSQSDMLLWETIAYTKNFEGSLEKYGFKNYRFYDEREIRYVPPFEELSNKRIAPFLSKEQYERRKKEMKSNVFIDEFTLKFNIQDIDYILVSNANQINRIKTKLIGEDNTNIPFLSYKQVRDDILGINHNKKK